MSARTGWTDAFFILLGQRCQTDCFTGIYMMQKKHRATKNRFEEESHVPPNPSHKWVTGAKARKTREQNHECRLVPTFLRPHHKQKQRVANDPLVSRVLTGSVSRHDCEKQQLLICFHAFTESNWGSDGTLTLQTEWGEASGHGLNEDVKADLMG